PPRKIVANLPYHVATPLLLGWMRHAAAFETLTLMFQKEVADRLLAAPRSKDYGRLSVIVPWLCEVRRLFDLPAKAFVPPARLVTLCVPLTPRPAPAEAVAPYAPSVVTKAACGHRRKMVGSSLGSLPVDALTLMDAAGLRPDARAEELTVDEFCALARALGA